MSVNEIIVNKMPVGVKIFYEIPPEGIPGNYYRGISYCDAVRRASQNEEIFLLHDSIRTCRWSPVVIGFKDPENNFEKRLLPRLKEVAGIFLAPLPSFIERGLEFDIAIVMDEPGFFKKILFETGFENAALSFREQMDKSALGIVGDDNFSFKSSATVLVNRFLAALARSSKWRTVTEIIFSNNFACDVFDRIISFFMADMSVCRNSTVIPYQSGLVNVSHYCSGGISWGLNQPHHLTAGFPADFFQILTECNLSLKCSETKNNLDYRPVFPRKGASCKL